MKNIIKSIPLLIVPFLVGCTGSTMVVKDNTTAIASLSNVNSTSISFSCQKCVGDITYRINVKENQSLDIVTSVKVTTGSVSFLVTDSDANEIFNQTISEDSDFTISLKDYGKHLIKIDHDNFKGSYKLDWSKKSAD